MKKIYRNSLCTWKKAEIDIYENIGKEYIKIIKDN